MSANFLGREKNYQNVLGFREGNLSIAEAFAPAATYAERIDRLFGEVAAMGFKGIDLWTAHCNPDWAGPQHFAGVRAAAERHGVEIVSLAGAVNMDQKSMETACRMARELGCSLLGMSGKGLPEKAAEMEEILAAHEVRLGFENHPQELTPQIVLERIGHGKYHHIGATFDTGWWATHDYPVLRALDELRDHLMLVHLKNIVAAGAHEAAPWETGCLDMKPIVLHLRKIGYTGWMSLEYEPLDVDPTEACRNFLQTVTGWWNEPTASN